MKKAWLALVIFLVSILSFTSMQADAAGPKVTYKTYKERTIQYAVISGSQYKAVNAKMYDQAKETYRFNKKYTKQSADYYAAQSCETVYKNKTKVSILCHYKEYTGGAHPNHFFTAYSTYKGKHISLKKAFKSDKDYKKGKKYAKQYMLNRPNKYRLVDDSTTIAGQTYYWTNKGLNVVYSPYEVSSYTDGMMTVPIPKKYLKY